MLYRFAPHLKVLNFSGNKEAREEQREEIIDHVSSQVSAHGTSAEMQRMGTY